VGGQLPVGAQVSGVGSSALNEIQKKAVHEQLERVLKSAPFRQTKRCQDLLRYLIVRVLAADMDQLKERTIGVEVFGRDPRYDTNQDPVVRGAAMELRKRLAQYYLEAGDAEVRFEVPSGSYALEFHWPVGHPVAAAPVGTVPPLHRHQGLPARSLAVAGGIIAATFCVLFLGFFVSSGHSAAVDEFWAPVLSGPRPVLLCIGLEPTYAVSGPLQSALNNSPTLPGSMLVTPNDIQSVPPRLVPLGDAISLSRFTALFSRKGKSYQIRGVSGTSFADLRDFPTVLIGAYSNSWTTQLNARFRFTFSPTGVESRIEDRLTPGRIWRIGSSPPDWKVPIDYAIASRILDPSTGNMVVTAAGLLHFGTEAAGELLTDSKYLEQATQMAPRDWQRKNLQIVLRTKVIGNTAGPPEILATHFW
jgi:hypothetical protein